MNPFLASKTKPVKFYVGRQDWDVDMMRQSGVRLNYTRNDDIKAQVVELPYKGKNGLKNVHGLLMEQNFAMSFFRLNWPCPKLKSDSKVANLSFLQKDVYM